MTNFVTQIGASTGSGSVVLATSPTLVTPTLGAATATSVAFSPTTNGIIGTATNDNASSTYVGEVISSAIVSASAVTATSNTATNVTTVSLTAGDWDVYGNITWITLGTAPTSVAAWISSSNATTPDPSLYARLVATGLTADTGIATPTYRASLSGTTTIYLSGLLSNTSGNGTACGNLFARRRR